MAIPIMLSLRIKWEHNIEISVLMLGIEHWASNL